MKLGTPRVKTPQILVKAGEDLDCASKGTISRVGSNVNPTRSCSDPVVQLVSSATVEKWMRGQQSWKVSVCRHER